MNYLKNLTLRQWAIIVIIIAFFVASYFLFFKKNIQPEVINLKTLMDQSTAPASSEENIGKAGLEKLLNRETPLNTTTPKPELTTEQRDDLFKLMSAPKAK